ncbi:class I SAM-dependent methyltransferase [Streptomyces spiramyceticus]|uniref:class I SAM-dependent methyltransferase n=1 Tax=Streptomyces spiramyceticus TaxID=299717 RepID=UPI00237BF207|nr:class I SAM-dependent methyltransferase [Streptomyces spiramyceticus]
MLDYDAEAAQYDAIRGGVPRAEAAARAVLGLVPGRARTLLDIGCGTGIVTARLVRPGLRVLGADAAYGMARKAADRLGPGAVVLADVRRLPLPTASVDAVSAVWLLHLVRDAGDAEDTVAEAARVLRPGGVFVTTVDKDDAHDVGCDIDAVLAPYRTADAFDRTELIEAYGAEHGLTAVGEARFVGHGQGRSPLRTAEALRKGRYASRITVRGAAAEDVATALSALPDPESRRPDPTYRLLALRKEAGGG